MDSEDEAKPSVIIDNGTGYCKAGFSSYEEPRIAFPSVVGYPKYNDVVGLGSEKQEFYVGPDAIYKKGV